MLRFDHVILAVDSLADAAARLRESTGLDARPGGRHPGHGTENWIAPLGRSYLELMAVADPDEAARSPLGRAITAAASRNELFALCVRTDDIESTAARLGLETLAMSRVGADGRRMSWRLAGLEVSLADGLPFFIQWDTDAHPGTGDEADGDIRWVELGADPEALSAWLGDDTLDLRAVPGPAGPRRVGLHRGGRELVLGATGSGADPTH